MASSVSGIAGSVQMGQKSTNYAGGIDFMQLAQRIVQMREAKQTHETQKLDMMMKTIQAGLPIDPSAVERQFKKVGIPLMKPEDLKAFVASHGQGGGQPGAGGGASAPGGGTPMGEKIPGTGGATPTSVIAQGNKTIQDHQTGALDALIAHAIKMNQLKGDTEQKQAEFANQTATWKNEILKDPGGPESMRKVGMLQKVGELPFDLKQEQWQSATPEQRAGIIDMAAGRMTQKDIEEESKDFATTFVSTGRISDMGDALRAGRALSTGGDIPQDIRARMKPFTFNELASQAELVDKAVQAGVPPNRIGEFVQKASLVGFDKALPKDIRPVVLQQLDVSRAHLGIAQQELQVRKAEVMVTASKMDLMAKNEANREIMDNFRSMLDMEKIKKGSVPKEVLDASMDEIAKRSGLQVKEVKGFWDYLLFRGPTGKEYVPGPAYEGLTPGSAGTPQTGKESGISRFIKEKAAKAGRQIKGVLEGEDPEDVAAREGTH